MMLHWLFVSLCFALLSYALWRWTHVTRDMLETRRHGLLMEHLDWTRTTRPTRVARKRGFLDSIIGR
jgi:hypothetical protein